MAYPSPPPAYGQTTTSGERIWALTAHLGSLVTAWFALGLLAPLAVLLLMGSGSDFVRRHATESLNFQISLLIYSVVATAFAVLTLGVGLLIIIPVGAVVALVALIAIIIASVAANRGEDFRYPLSIRILR